MARDKNTVLFEDARLMFKNFAGRERQFNPEGDRNFTLFLSPEDAEVMRRDGWNVKQLNPREEGDIPQDILKVKVGVPKPGSNGSFATVYLITSGGKTQLDPETVGMIDFMRIKTADLIIRPYDWEINGRTGRTAYLKSLFVTMDEDELDVKYAGVKTVDNVMDAPDNAGDVWGQPGDEPF